MRSLVLVRSVRSDLDRHLCSGSNIDILVRRGGGRQGDNLIRGIYQHAPRRRRIGAIGFSAIAGDVEQQLSSGGHVHIATGNGRQIET